VQIVLCPQAYAQTVYSTNLTGPKQVPPNTSPGTGTGNVTLQPDGKSIQINLTFSNLLGTQTNAHIHGPAAPGDTNAIIVVIPNGSPVNNYSATLNPQQIQWLQTNLLYLDVHSTVYPDGEIRGQLLPMGNAAPTPAPSCAGEPNARASHARRHRAPTRPSLCPVVPSQPPSSCITTTERASDNQTS